MTTKPKRIIYALSAEEVDRDEVYDGIRYAATELFDLDKYFSSCKIRDTAQRAIPEFLDKGNEIRNLDNTPYEFPSDEELFGPDPFFRWFDKDFIGKDEKGEYHIHRARCINRVIFFDLFLQIKFSMSIARHYR